MDYQTMERDPIHENGEGSGSRFRRSFNKYRIWILSALVIFLLVTTVALAVRGRQVEYIHDGGVTTSSPLPAQCPNTATKVEDRFNCHPEAGVTETTCLARNCCFEAVNGAPEAASCYFPPDFEGYTIKSLVQDAYKLFIELDRVQQSGFPKDVQRLNLEVTLVNEQLVRMKLYDPSKRRYEVQLPIPLDLKYSNHAENFLCNVTVTDKGILTIVRKSSGKVLVDTDLRRLIFSEQFLQISWKTPGNYLYGLSEHKAQFRKQMNWTTYTIFNRGEQPRERALMNLYGTHPFYLMTEDNGDAHGVFLLNSNAQDVILQPAPGLTWRSVGGIFDFFVFLGPSPTDVVKQFSSLVGKPFLPPYWSLGFHLSRYGYYNIETMKATWNRTIAANIPFDVQWNDIDVMSDHNDFTYDHENFTGLPEFVDHLHDVGMKWVPIQDPGVSNKENEGYAPYDDGVLMDIFVKNSTGQPICGKVWNRNTTVFVDFTNPNAVEYWAKQLDNLHQQVKFDGLWVDMNEPYTFVTGSDQSPACPDDPLERPSYVPGGDPLNTHTLCMTAQHYLGAHYNVHSIYAHYEYFVTNS